ncbi:MULTISPECIES: alpha/beta hydrolase [Mesorhizobium]|uniref:alpha/beta fold hydrolase n=1 Tax=Mesorhizobium sp. TaxID=1871066 RepID=UPI000691383E|nr:MULTISPECIES: alpha/beta hydrolase [Mesorhizobium]RWM69142.1 MAG: alpha/beta hydrolase [Mesorhizobium sp.]TIO20986.1 MAG: alpha/beta hydrolase [Mesorhizobium sp.]TJV55147.1 MAG: alpha/beta hydrolase [Mesorhizobium sp.]
MTSTRSTSLRQAVVAGLAGTALLAVLITSTTANPTTSAEPSQTGFCDAACVETKTFDVDGVAYAYRTLVTPSGTPLVLLNRFRGTIDEWDPAFLDHVAASRYVVIFDNIGVARSGGEAPLRMADWARNAGAFIDGLGFKQVDLLGFSFGGLVAQELTLQRPGLVRRLVIAGSGAGYVEGANLNPMAIEVATKPTNTDDDFLFLFFKDTQTSQAAGRAHLARLRERKDSFARLVSEKNWKAMLAAAGDLGTPETSLLNRVGAIRQPVLVGNGNEDVMIPTLQSYALAQAIPNARLIVYPDSGHAFLFQYPREFGDEVIRFLGEESQS